MMIMKKFNKIFRNLIEHLYYHNRVFHWNSVKALVSQAQISVFLSNLIIIGHNLSGADFDLTSPTARYTKLQRILGHCYTNNY